MPIRNDGTQIVEPRAIQRVGAMRRLVPVLSGFYRWGVIIGAGMRTAVLPLLLLSAAPASAEVELSFYGGWQGAPDGAVTISGADEADNQEVSLDSESGFGFGARATYWTSSDFGVALDYSRYGGEGQGAGAAVSDTEVLTLGGLYRWDEAFGGVTPYVGAGLGLASTDIDVDEPASGVDARGPAASIVAGAEVPLTDSLSVFGEYEGTYVDLEGDTDDGRSVRTDGISSSINLGVSFSF